MSAELQTFLIALSPIVELRGSIPFALQVLGMSPLKAFLISILGNILPAIFLIKLLGIISDFLSHHFYFFNRFFAWLFAKTRKDHSRKFQRFKEFALIILVAIPLPFTGVWTGSLCAFLFGIPLKRALPLITIGCLLAGLIVTLVSLGLFKAI